MVHLMSNKALIISPTGCPLYYDDAYDRNNHWRLSKSGRSYDVAVVVFNDYVPEPGTYDYLIKKKGLKFHLIKDVCDNFIKWEDYDYIGTWDDDYATDIQSVERALYLARKFDFRMFQQSMISWNTYPCLVHDPKFVWTETNFIETGVPFFRNDIFRKFLRFLGDYQYKQSEWGIDKILCDLMDCSAHVVHDTTAKHMRSESWYSKEEAFKEMAYLTDEFMPKYMKEKFGRDWKFQDRQEALCGLLKDKVKF
jgi:hypothetical protein